MSSVRHTGGWFVLAESNGAIFQDALCNDVLIYTSGSQQNIRFGLGDETDSSMLVLSKNEATLNTDLLLQGQGSRFIGCNAYLSMVQAISTQTSSLTLNGSNNTVFIQPTTNNSITFSNTSANVILGLNKSNIGINNTIPQYTLDITGDVNITGHSSSKVALRVSSNALIQGDLILHGKDESKLSITSIDSKLVLSNAFGSTKIGVSNDNIILHGSIIPSTSTVDLGSFEKPFRHVFVSSDTMYIGSNALSSRSDGSLRLFNAANSNPIRLVVGEVEVGQSYCNVKNIIRQDPSTGQMLFTTASSSNQTIVTFSSIASLLSGRSSNLTTSNVVLSNTTGFVSLSSSNGVLALSNSIGGRVSIGIQSNCLGIGVANPTSTLHVAGGTIIDGPMSVKGIRIGKGNPSFVDNATIARLNLLEQLSSFGAANIFAVRTSGLAYTINGFAGINPTIHVLGGLTYAFDLGSNILHPFVIRDANGGNNIATGFSYIDMTSGDVVSGVSANTGRTSGRLYWTIPPSTFGTYVYQAINQGSMVGNIVIKNISAL